MSQSDAAAPVEADPFQADPFQAEQAWTEPAQTEPGRAAHIIDRVVRVAGLVIAVLAAIVTALLELLLSPLRAGGVLIGVAALIAVVANLAISWFAVTTVGRRWAVGPPWAVWTLVMFFAVGVRKDEGDYLVSGDNWVGLIMILLGSLVFAVYLYRLILRGPEPVAARDTAPGNAPGGTAL